MNQQDEPDRYDPDSYKWTFKSYLAADAERFVPIVTAQDQPVLAV